MTAFKWPPKKKDEIRRVLAYWIHEFAIPPATIAINFLTDNEETPHGGNAAMCVRIGYPYRFLEIDVFPAMAGYGRDKIRLTAIHEILHVAMARLKYFRRKDADTWHTLEEETVDLIANVIDANAKRGI